MSSRWRVGRKVPRNIYCDDEPVAMIPGPAAQAERMARYIVLACNEMDKQKVVG